MLDQKEWIQDKAEELAEEEYEMDFYNLNDNTQGKIWERAEKEWIDYYSGYCDHIYETIKDRKQEGK